MPRRKRPLPDGGASLSFIDSHGVLGPSLIGEETCPELVLGGNKQNVSPLLPKWWSQLQTPKPNLVVGGRLTHFLPQWEEVTSDPWTLSIIREGLGLDFHHPPPLSLMPIHFPPPVIREKRLALEAEVLTMLKKGAIVELLEPPTAGFYSRLFLVTKKTGGFRPIIDLSCLNKFIVSPHFKMETSRSIISSVTKNLWATSIDLKDAYFHVPMKKSFQKYLRFTCQGRVFQFVALPFGLTIAPLIFTKIMRAVIGYLHKRGLQIHIYFDDSILLNLDRQALSLQTKQTVNLLLGLGFLISQTKSEIIPLQDFVFLGHHFRSDLGLIFPTEEKFQKVVVLVGQFLSMDKIQVRWLLQFIGYLNCLIDVIPLGRLHIRPLHFFLLSNWSPASQEWDAWIPSNHLIRQDIQWWTVRANVMSGVPLDKASPTSTLYTDASLVGWGAYLNGHCASGTWSEEEMSLHINVLEMKAVLLSLQALTSQLQNLSFCLATDNSTVVAYLKNQGGRDQSSYL